MLSSCQSSQSSVRETAVSPCNDSLFLVLKKKDMSLLTYEEKQYFTDKRNECSEALKEEMNPGNSSSVRTGLLIIGGAILVIGVIGLTIASSKTH